MRRHAGPIIPLVKFASFFVGPYYFHDAKNADRTAESNHKNGIYSTARSVTEFGKFCIKKSKGALYT